MVTVKSATMHIPDGYTFIIKAVEFKDEGGGKTAELSLVPFEVYSGEEFIDPWA